jgi:hypothetical protein
MNSTLIVRGVKYLLYTSIVAFIIFLILIVIHYTVKPMFDFLPTNVVETTTPQTYIGKTLFADSPATADTKMTFNPGIIDLNKDNFTLTFDCYLDGTYRSTTVPRVLAYYGSSAVNISSNNDLREYYGNSEKETPRILTTDNSDLLVKFQNSNFIIYVDPVKNDLKVGVFTVDKQDPTKKYLEIASIILNIPINQPFQVTMVLGRTFVEVYKDKKLFSTYKIGSLAPTRVNLNTTAVPSSNYGVFTPTSFIGGTIKIGSVQFYNGSLTSGQVRELTNILKPATFFRKTN